MAVEDHGMSVNGAARRFNVSLTELVETELMGGFILIMILVEPLPVYTGRRSIHRTEHMKAMAEIG